MSREAWQQLVRRYCPSDKRVCNCGDAYYTKFPASSRTAIRGGEYVDHWACASGCSAAQITAKEIVARGVLADLPPDTGDKQ